MRTRYAVRASSFETAHGTGTPGGYQLSFAETFSRLGVPQRTRDPDARQTPVWLFLAPQSGNEFVVAVADLKPYGTERAQHLRRRVLDDVPPPGPVMGPQDRIAHRRAGQPIVPFA